MKDVHEPKPQEQLERSPTVRHVRWGDGEMPLNSPEWEEHDEDPGRVHPSFRTGA